MQYADQVPAILHATMARPSALAAIAVLVALAGLQVANGQSGKPGPWHLGRATYYGKDGW